MSMHETIPAGDETELNMTPMIDVVFQLIIFFLLSLKFRAVDRRIESHLPKDRGCTVSTTPVEELPTITVKLFRQDLDSPDRAWTSIRVGNAASFDLPRGTWSGREADDAARRDAYESTTHEVAAAIREIWSRMGHDPEVQGVIRTPPPKGLRVPHGDVMQVLDAFVEAGLEKVRFVGAPAASRRGQ